MKIFLVTLLLLLILGLNILINGELVLTLTPAAFFGALLGVAIHHHFKKKKSKS